MRNKLKNNKPGNLDGYWVFLSLYTAYNGTMTITSTGTTDLGANHTYRYLQTSGLVVE